MKAISLWQPWASLIAEGAKHFETRSWSTSYRGEIAIHAAKRWTNDQLSLVSEHPFGEVLNAGGYWRNGIPRGCVVAVAEIDACLPTYDIGGILSLSPAIHEADFGDFGHRRFAWHLNNVRRLPVPVEAVGHQGVFELDAIVEQAIRGR